MRSVLALALSLWLSLANSAAADRRLIPAHDPRLLTQARGVIYEAIGAARQVEDDREILVANLCGAMAHAGDVDGALQAAFSLLKDSERGHALWSIAWAQAHAGDFAGARLTALRIGKPELRANAIGDIAIALVKFGEPETARVLVGSIPAHPPWIRIEAMRRLANALVDAGYARRAIATLQDAVALALAAMESQDPSEGWNPTSALVSLAFAQKRAGDSAGSASTIEKVRQLSGRRADPNEGILLLQNLAELHAEADEIGMALEAALQIPRGQQRDNALQRIVAVQARSRAFLGARETAELIRDADLKALAHQAIAQEQVTSGDLVGAQESLEQIADLKLRAKKIVWTALSLTEVNQATAALLWIERARGLVQSARLEMEPEFYGWIATVQANAGDFWGGREVARSIPDRRTRSDALLHVAYSHAASGDWRGAAAWATEEPDPRGRAEALLGVAWALIDRSELEKKTR